MRTTTGDVITSPHNARIAAARKLHQGKERAAAGAFLVEGPHAVEAAIVSSPGSIRELFLTAGVEADDDVLRRATAAGVPVVRVNDRVAAALSDTRHPQGVVAVVDLPDVSLDAVLGASPRLVVVLAGAADPGNAGTVIRTADAAGADAVIVTRGSVDPFGGKCVRATAGSIFHLPVVAGLEIGASINALRDAGLQVLAATLDGEDLDGLAAELAAPTAWLLGSEAHGLDATGVAGADRRVRIPMHGRAESLNLATAAALCLYASVRAQGR